MAPEATSWTRPLQLAVAAWFVVAGVLSLVSSLVNLGAARTAAEDQLRKSELSGTQLDQAVTAGIVIGVAVTVVLVALYLLGAVASFRGWLWGFWFALALLGLASLFAITGLIGIIAGGNSTIPAGWTWAGELVQLVGLGLFAWMLVAVIRYGPWAKRRIGP